VAASEFVDIENNIRDTIVSYTFAKQIELRNKGIL